jgi:hypothetical protein
MKLFINIIVQIVSIISYSVTALFALFGIYELIMGPADAEKLLKKLHIPLSYNQTLIIGFIFIILAIAGHIIKAKLTGKL